ncbi:MAG: hypothetical protein ACRD0P_28600, partial [Stackebrandtia sp.]
MRRRLWMVPVAVAATAAAVSAGLVWADDADPATEPESAGVGPDATVTLPTGDTVSVNGDMLSPSGGAARAGMAFHSMTLPSGDRLVLPADQTGAVFGGTDDDRLYNVDALLRNGVTDARTVDDPETLTDATLRSPQTKADAVTVTVEATWWEPEVTPDVAGVWVNLDTGESAGFGGDGSEPVTADLEPGRYAILTSMSVDGDEHQAVGDVTEIEVADAAITVPVDGTAAKPIGFDVDRPAELAGREADVFVKPDCACDPVTFQTFVTGASDVRMIPSGDGDSERGLVLRDTMAGTDGSYTYNLARVSGDGIPAEPVFKVSDADLAARDVDYADMGGDGDLERVVLSDNEEFPPLGAVYGDTVAVPGEHTELFSV